MMNLENIDIIIVGQQPWDTEIGSNCKNIALEMSKRHRVLYVNSPLKRSEVVKNRNHEKIIKRLAVVRQKENGLIKIKDNLWTLYPDFIAESVNWLPDNFIFDFFNKRNNKKFASSIKRALQKLDFKNYLVFNDNEIFDSFYLKELLSPQLYIYYLRDFMVGSGFWKKHGSRLEPDLISKSDIIFTNSAYLRDYGLTYNSQTYNVGQGCDFELFEDPDHITIPPEILNIPHPVIGYVGLLSNRRLDIEIIKSIALANKSWSIVLVGPEDESFEKSVLHEFDNIYFTGQKPTESLAAYIQSFDVCINPQLINELTIGNYPRKIDEYLALGKPVVATKTKAMDMFEDFVALASQPHEYPDLIEICLKDDTIDKKNSRREFALSHTWENSVNKMYEVIKVSKSQKDNIHQIPLLVLGLNRFDSDIGSTSFNIAKEFAQQNEVYYIDYPFTFRDYFNFKGTPAFNSRKPYFFFARNRILPDSFSGIKILIPPLTLSINFLPEGFLYRTILKLNEWILTSCIKRFLKRNNIRKFIFLNAFNFHYPNVGRYLNPWIYIYHCVDPLILDYDRRHGMISEDQIIKDCDAVICTSKQLYREKKQIKPETYFIPNAADIDHFSKALTINQSSHPLLQDIPQPIIGYIGNIERRIDFELLSYVATQHPDKSFVFIGPSQEEFIPENFAALPNIYLPGKADYSDLPELLSQFKVAIIPFKKDKVSSSIFPLKLFEYLGAGLPVISTDFNQDLKDFTKETVYFCSNQFEFSEHIMAALQEENEEKKNERKLVAQEHTWKNRFLAFKSVLEKNFR